VRGLYSKSIANFHRYLLTKKKINRSLTSIRGFQSVTSLIHSRETACPRGHELITGSIARRSGGVTCVLYELHCGATQGEWIAAHRCAKGWPRSRYSSLPRAQSGDFGQQNCASSTQPGRYPLRIDRYNSDLRPPALPGHLSARWFYA
jgi:hypothetical protein